jgi:hypothetical protein
MRDPIGIQADFRTPTSYYMLTIRHHDPDMGIIWDGMPVVEGLALVVKRELMGETRHLTVCLTGLAGGIVWAGNLPEIDPLNPPSSVFGCFGDMPIGGFMYAAETIAVVGEKSVRISEC